MARFSFRSIFDDGLLVLLIVLASLLASTLEVVALHDVAFGAVGPMGSSLAVLGPAHAPLPAAPPASAGDARILTSRTR